MAPRISSSAASSSAASAELSSKKRTSSSSQPSRKSKAAWRKNIDLRDVDEHLESQRVAERLGLAPASNSTSSQGDDSSNLFSVDTTGDDVLRQRLSSKRAKKPMRSLQALQNASAVKPVTARRGVVAAPEEKTGMYGTKEKSTGKLSKSEQNRLRRIAGRPIKGPFGAIVESEQGNALESVKGRVMKLPRVDAWQVDDAVAEQKQKGDATHQRTRRPHESNDERESLAKQASAAQPLGIPTSGQSYNPTLDAHSSLLQRAYEIEKAKVETEEKDRAFKELWRQAVQSNDDNSASANRFAGMIIGDGDEDEDDTGSSSSGSEDQDADDAAASAAPARKTRDQRKRAQRAKDQELLAAQRREAKALRHHLSQLPTLEKQLKRQLSSRQAAISQRREAKRARLQSSGLSGERVGKYKLPSDLLERSAEDVQLGEDLSEGLRGVKPEGNLFRDRWDSLVARGKAEYRRPISEVGKGRRKRGSQRIKEYETHAYKRFQ